MSKDYALLEKEETLPYFYARLAPRSVSRNLNINIRQ